MTEYLKSIVIAQIAIAILILPSSALAACNGSAEEPDWSNFSSPLDGQTRYEYCKSPVAYDGTVTMNDDTPVEITLHATDPDGDTMTYSIDSDPLHGILGTITGNWVVYIPDANYTGVDSFSFRANDGTWDSNTATVTITIGPEYSPQVSHFFYGNVTIDGEVAPEHTMIGAAGPGVSSDSTGNPVLTLMDGSYGSAGLTAQNLAVQGCIEDGTPLAFYADGVQAEVYDVNSSGPWQSAYPFRAGAVTNLNIRVTSTNPPQDKVYINAIGVTISNSTYGFSSITKLEREPWMELTVTSGMFDIQISATGFHVFHDQPLQGRSALLAIYENGIPVSSERTVWFGSRSVRYEYLATETRTFDILIYVKESPEIFDVKHLTVHVVPGSE